MTRIKVEKILKKILLPEKDLYQIPNYIEEGILDSFSILILIAEIDKEFSIQIDMENFETDNFKNVNKIVSFVNKTIKKQKK